MRQCQYLSVNLRKSKKSINGVSNGGTIRSELEDNIPRWFIVYYNPESVMNVSSFKNLRKRFQITMDSTEESAFHVHVSKDKVTRFE